MRGRAEAPFAVRVQVFPFGNLTARKAFAIRWLGEWFVGPHARDAERRLALAVHRARGPTLKNEWCNDGLGSSHFSDEDPRVEDASAAGCSGPLPAPSARIVEERRTEAGRTAERAASIVNDADPDE